MSYNAYQQTFVLSIMSNMVSGVKTSTTNDSTQVSQALTAELKTLIQQVFGSSDSNIQSCLQGWNLAWGPYVYVDPEDIQPNDNGGYNVAATQAIFVANNGSQYVVAVAGTNGASKYDLYEDGDITLAVWPYGSNTGNPRVTQGTLAAINVLLNDMGGSLPDYLASLPDGSTVTFTGHSLGGGITPALATALFNSQTTVNSALPGKIIHNGWTVRIYPTAGPDVGNSDYVSLVRGIFKASNQVTVPVWQQWNQKIWNSIDMVPQVWSKGFESAIDNLYEPNMATPKYVRCIVDRANLALMLGYPAPLDPGKLGQFRGVYQDIPSSECSGCDSNTELCEFMAEVLYQHVAAYVAELQVAPVVEAIDAISGQQPIDACTTANLLYQADIAKCRTMPLS